MKASLLYVGEHYAYYKDPPKGKIPIGAVKVRLRYTEQRKRSTMDNRQTFAAVTVVETEREIVVRARDLIDFWDAYKDEETLLLKERRDREKATRRIQLRDEITQTVVNYRLQERNIPLTANGVWSDRLSFSLKKALAWLEISEEEIDKALDEAVAREFDEA